MLSGPAPTLSAELDQLKVKWRAPFFFLPPPYRGVEISQLEISFNAKMRSRAGVCKMRHTRWGLNTRVSGSIELNPHLLTTTEKLEEVLVHELCHFVIGARWPRAQPHGQKWRALMVMMGFEPRRCHTLIPVRQNQQRRWPLHCVCRVHNVTTVIFNRIQRGQLYKCRHCAQILGAPTQGLTGST